MITPGSDEEQTFEASLGALQTAGKAPLNVLGKSVDSMRLVTTQGSVFGVRGGGGAWRFFVQRRALVEYFHRSTTRKTRLFRSAKVTVDIESLGMQWVIRDVPEFWPGMGTGRLVT